MADVLYLKNLEANLLLLPPVIDIALLLSACSFFRENLMQDSTAFLYTQWCMQKGPSRHLYILFTSTLKTLRGIF